MNTDNEFAWRNELRKLRGDHSPEIMDRLGRYARQAVPEGCKIMIIDDHVEVSKISVS